MFQPKEARAASENWDYLAPIVADGDMGFRGLTSTIKVTKLFVEAGVAMFHLDDLAIGGKSSRLGREGLSIQRVSIWKEVAQYDVYEQFDLA